MPVDTIYSLRVLQSIPQKKDVCLQTAHPILLDLILTATALTLKFPEVINMSLLPVISTHYPANKY